MRENKLRAQQVSEVFAGFNCSFNFVLILSPFQSSSKVVRCVWGGLGTSNVKLPNFDFLQKLIMQSNEYDKDSIITQIINRYSTLVNE